MRAVTKLGGMVWHQWDELRYSAAVIGTVLCFQFQPRCWNRTVRNRFSTQVLTAGVQALGFVSSVAVLVGISVVAQIGFWTVKAGQSQLLGPLLVTVVVRELGPILSNIVVIVRSSYLMPAELAILKANGEVNKLESQNKDPLVLLVLPRVLGMALSTFCLTIVFILVALSSGYFFGAWLGMGSRDVWFFSNTVLEALQPQDVANIIAKSILPALFTSASCCIAGLSVNGSLTETSNASQRVLTRSLIGLFAISSVVSLLTYL